MGKNKHKKISTKKVWKFIKPFVLSRLDKLGEKYIIEYISDSSYYYKIEILFDNGFHVRFIGDKESVTLYGGKVLSGGLFRVDLIRHIAKYMVSS